MAQVAAVRAGVVVAQVGVAAVKAAAEVVVAAAGAVAAEVVVAVGAAEVVVAVATPAERTTRRRPSEIRALSVVPARVFLSTC